MDLVDLDKIIEKDLIYYDSEGNLMVLYNDLYKCKVKLPKYINPYMKENSDFIDCKYIHGWNSCLDEILGGIDER